ncbi:hypothetical protein HK105_204799 [Polyrhizophydium stewartii]|uniref:Ankyrin repeat protein n=1 Tax=Polyrhizophydium stewartii TaxID=2732419 RepID=A0ABR4N838_9FUNG
MLGEDRSHWDRLPHDLRRVALESAGLLTMVLNGLVLVAEISSRGDLLERLWIEVYESDWPGDLQLLPAPLRTGEAALSIRSWGMLSRVQAAGFYDDTTIQRVVIRNRWAKLVDLSRPVDAARTAALEGAVWLLEKLIDESRLVSLGVWLVEHAAAGGQLEAVMWLDWRMTGARWPRSVMDAAAGSGNLELVEWLDQHRDEGCTQLAMVNAARGGHLAVVRWLSETHILQCPPSAAELAAVAGHFEVLIYLCARFPDVFAELRPTFSIEVLDLGVLQLLHRFGLVRHPTKLLKHHAKHGTPESLAWICATFDVHITQEMLAMPEGPNSVEVVAWMLTQPRMLMNEALVVGAIWRQALDVLDFVIRRSDAWARIVAEKVVKWGGTDLLEWLYVRHPRCITHETLEFAVRHAKVELVEYLLENVVEVKWNLAWALSFATSATNQPPQLREATREIAAIIKSFAARKPA